MNYVINNIHQLANFAVLSALILISIAILKSRNLLSSVALLSVFSMLMALEYLLLGAPDVAITEAAVGAGISTILLLLGLFLITQKDKHGTKKQGRVQIMPLILVAGVTAILIYASRFLPEFGSATTPAQTHVGGYYIANSLNDTGVPNVVTAILASYRGYDTLGETIVIFAGGIAVFMLLSVNIRKKK